MLQAKNLSMRYEGKLALKNLSFTVAPGEIFCLLGQNGAGKTTTINIFLGLIEPTSGEALIGNSSIIKNKSSRSAIAYIPEIVQLYGNLSGLENLEFFSRLAGFVYSQEELASFLQCANLQEEAHKKRLSTYSKGMRQKVGIAIALAKNANYILMDEPTSGLDPKASVEFAKICKELSTNGVAILMATHDIFNAVNIGSKIGIMREGTLVHTTETSKISAQELQDLYIKTI
ncbi:ABC transporter ATP-binding protein [Flavivirga aquatica]|uniref:ABC transporter ATP-binding protein n=1 Tax=Flavivirga aquatica TaxID=1849968 RepID=A0A1E5TAJ3_9FLAO|nr:ABC transporter ATP-binding protein [Flavivirga aquatica]OEK08327.1 ABC transporter ATP-binding protein [Flavivirga aquatica]